jgi:thioredoxin 1
MTSKSVITELTVDTLKQLQATLGKRVLIIKFGADWCGPCKKIAPMTYAFYNNCADNILFADINVDHNMNLFATLKRNKMVSGIPVFFAFYGNATRERWFIPDDSVVGADEQQVAQFFLRSAIKANELKVN